MTKIEQSVSNTLQVAQINMPDGQSYNLYSKAACDILAEKIIAGLQHNNYTVLSPPYDDPDEIEMKMNKDAHIPDIINNSIKKKTSGSE